MSLETVILQDEAAGTLARVLPGFGMNCYSFEVSTSEGRRDLLWAVSDFATGKERASSSGIPILFPFVGRLRGTHLLHEGKTYAFPAGDGIGNAIHGFVIDRPWEVVEQTSQTVVGRIQPSVNASELRSCWPTDFCLTAKYKLTAHRLRLTITIENPDERPLPFGFGTHPYFRVPTKGDWKVAVPANRYWPLEAMLPTGEQLPVDVTRDLRGGRPFEQTELDDVLGDLEFEEDICRTMLSCNATGEQIIQDFGNEFRECVVYTPPHREAICIEPYTSVPNAEELLRKGIDSGWQSLMPGQRWESKIDISYSREG